MVQMLKHHDQQVQEAVRRARDKTKVRKVQAENSFFSGQCSFNTHTYYQHVVGKFRYNEKPFTYQHVVGKKATLILCIPCTVTVLKNWHRC